MAFGRHVGEQNIKSQMEKGEVDNTERDRGREGGKPRESESEIAGEGEDGGKYRGRGSGEV